MPLAKNKTLTYTKITSLFNNISIVMPINSPSLKDTKQVILDAYEEAMQLLAQKDTQSLQASSFGSNSPQPKSKPFDPQSPEEIVSKIGELKLGINKILGNLVDDLTNQSSLLTSTKVELEITKKELEETHKIKQTATTLQNLLNLNQDKKTELEKELEDFEIGFELKQSQKTKEQKEQEENLKVSRKREQEEFDYNLKQLRKKEEDEYEAKKLLKVKDLETRERELLASEIELSNLRKLATELESRLESEVQKCSQKAIQDTTKDLEIKYNLERKDVEMQSQLSQMTIQNQQKSIAQLESEVIELKKQLISATQQVKDIAVKVIESKQAEKVSSGVAQS